MDRIELTATHQFSAVALRQLADQIETYSLSDSTHIPSAVALLRDGQEWTALAILIAIPHPQ